MNYYYLDRPQSFSNTTVMFHQELDLIGVQCQQDCGEFISSMCSVGGGGWVGEEEWGCFGRAAEGQWSWRS